MTYEKKGPERESTLDKGTAVCGKSILILAQSAALGGATRSLSSTICALRESGAGVTVLAPPGVMKEEWQKMGAEVFSWKPPTCTWLLTSLFSSLEPASDFNTLSFQLFQMINLPKLIWQALRRIKEIVDKKAIAIIYVNSLAFFPIASSIALLRRKRSLRVIWHVREPARLSLPFFLRRLVVDSVASAAADIVAISSNEALPFEKKAHITVIHNTIPDEWLSHENFPSAPYHGKRVIMAASFFSTKGISDFFSMARLISERCPDAEMILYSGRPELHGGSVSKILHLAGKWNSRVNLALDMMKEMTECSINKRIRVIFNQPVRLDTFNKASVYVRADRAACPWGRDIIEAMWAGLPVVATGTSEEFVQNGHTGFLVPPLRPDLLADRVCQLLNDGDLRNAMGRAGLTRSRELFSPKLYKEKLLNVFNIG